MSVYNIVWARWFIKLVFFPVLTSSGTAHVFLVFSLSSSWTQTCTVASMLPFNPYVGDHICSSISRTLFMHTFGLASALPQWSAIKEYVLGLGTTNTCAQVCRSGNFSLISAVASKGVTLIQYNCSIWWMMRSARMLSRWRVEKSIFERACWNNSWIMEP